MERASFMERSLMYAVAILVKNLVKLLHGFAKVVTYISFALLNKTQEQRTQQCLKAQCLGSVMTLAMFKFFSYKMVLLYNQLAEL